MLKTAQLRFNGLSYGLRNVGDGWDVIFNDEIMEEGISSAKEAISFCKAHSKNTKYDHLRYDYSKYCDFTGQEAEEIEARFNRNCGPKD